MCVCVCEYTYIYNIILVSLKKEGNLSSETTWMDFEGIRLSAISRTKTNII